MNFHFLIRGYGFGFQVGGFSIVESCFVILSWSVIKDWQVWRSETHSRGDGIYHYRCVKNGKTVEDFTLQSPIVNHVVGN